MTQRLKQVEEALGRELTKEERERLALGLKAEDNSVQVVESTDPLTGEKTTRRTWRERPTEGKAAPGALTPGAVVGGYSYVGGDPRSEKSWREVPAGGGASTQQRTMRDPLTGADLSKHEWDRKYGKGDFDRVYGRDSLKAW